MIVATMRATLDEVLAVSERLCAHIDADRDERRALTAALDRLTRALERAPDRPEPAVKVIGGSFFGVGSNVLERATEPTHATPRVIDAGDHVVEVRCRFGDRWVDGFEVCQLVADDDRVRYRLRRRADGSVLPTLFDADDVRETRGGDRSTLFPTPPGRRWRYR